jgi:hypothetical protein
MRADSAILQRLIHMTYWLAPLILRLGTNQHSHTPATSFSATLAPWAWRASSANAWARYISGRSKDWLNFKNPTTGRYGH